MRKYLLLLPIFVSMAFLQCGDDEEVVKTDCELAASIVQDAIEAACAGKSCTFCECALQGLSMESTIDGTAISYSCSEAPATCDASAAADCLADEDGCSVNALTAAESACASSMIETE